MDEEIYFIEKHFDYIIRTDSDGDLYFPHYGIDYYGREELVSQMETIIKVKGFYRGNTKQAGKWIPKEDLIKIYRSNPEWIRTNQIANDYGI